MELNVVTLISIASVLAYLGVAVFVARCVADENAASPEGDALVAFGFGVFWPAILAVLIGWGALHLLTRFTHPSQVKAKSLATEALVLRQRAAGLHHSALLVEDTPAFGALEGMAADLRVQADDLDGGIPTHPTAMKRLGLKPVSGYWV